MPRRVREALAATIVTEMLMEGVYFESRNIWGLPLSKNPIQRTFRHLLDSRVIRRSKARGKYLLTDEFLEATKKDITKGMPRGNFVHFPDLGVFDICGIGSWTDEEFEVYVKRLKERWLLRRREAGAPVET